MHISLANAEAQEQNFQEQLLQKDATIQQLVDQNTELTNQNITIRLGHDSLKLAHEENSQQLKDAQKTLQESLDQINDLRIEHLEALFDRDAALEKAKQISEQAHETESRLQQTMQAIKSACDTTIDHERTSANEARSEVKALKKDIMDLQTKVGLAMRDAQRSHERASEAEETVKALEQRLLEQE
ncbi:hypothetical protein BJY00DRAFT_293434 [Aspergillus carlsbadensis]|nr:hypothetical protein BJY00DRAFT_293434 [Aspergillus carlsbadensis]